MHAITEEAEGLHISWMRSHPPSSSMFSSFSIFFERKQFIVWTSFTSTTSSRPVHFFFAARQNTWKSQTHQLSASFHLTKFRKILTGRSTESYTLYSVDAPSFYASKRLTTLYDSRQCTAISRVVIWKHDTRLRGKENTVIFTRSWHCSAAENYTFIVLELSLIHTFQTKSFAN